MDICSAIATERLKKAGSCFAVWKRESMAAALAWRPAVVTVGIKLPSLVHDSLIVQAENSQNIRAGVDSGAAIYLAAQEESHIAILIE